jgi:hypothetical protein
MNHKCLFPLAGLLFFISCTVHENGSVRQPEKQVPVIYDVDVAVAGAGESGVFAAIAAARNGAKTVLIERFGSIGGSSGAGLNVGGGRQAPGPWKEPPAWKNDGKAHVPPLWIYPEIAGIPKEFMQRLEALCPNDSSRSTNALARANAISYLATRMLEEAGVHLLLSTFVTDPIMKGRTVEGVFVENKSGRQAVKATVVIDATGEADVARRAGVPFLQPKETYYPEDGHSPYGIGFYAYIGGIDWKEYTTAVENRDERVKVTFPPRQIGNLGIFTRCTGFTPIDPEGGVAAVRVQIEDPKEPYLPYSKVDMGNGLNVSMLETGMRLYTYERVQWIREHLPGCSNCFLLMISPYLETRGGPCIVGEHTLTLEECKAAKKFDDVMYLYGHGKALPFTRDKQGNYTWADVPYRVMVPKNVDGLLAVGRSASGVPDTLLRIRTAVRHMGQAGGTAAALAVKQGVQPRNLDVKALQRKLLEAGFYLGDESRLRELGLASQSSGAGSGS